MDRLLTRAHELFPAGCGGGQLPTSGAGSVPGGPEGASGLRDGALWAASSYQQAQTSAAGLDEQLQAAAAQGGAIGAQGRVASGLIRDQARTTAATLMPLAHSPAGAQLMVAAMDQHLSAMQSQLASTTTQYQGVSATLQQVSAGFQALSGGAKDAPPAVPLDSETWRPGDKRHMPYDAGKGGMGPSNVFGSPPWVDIYDRTKDPDQVPHYFVRSDEIPGYKVIAPGGLGPSTVFDEHGNPDPYIELAPHSGVWVPQSAFPGAKIVPPGGAGDLPPYGWEEYLPGSGIYLWHGDLEPEPYRPFGPSGPPTIPQGGR